MVKHKVTLSGRMKTQQLGKQNELCGFSNKKEALLDLKQQIHNEHKADQSAESRKQQQQARQSQSGSPGQQTGRAPRPGGPEYGSTAGTSRSIAEQLVTQLYQEYQQWCEPLNRTRMRYSPNERNRMLVESIRDNVNEYGEYLLEQGYDEATCHTMCLDLVDELAERLRQAGIPLGNLRLSRHQ